MAFLGGTLVASAGWHGEKCVPPIGGRIAPVSTVVSHIDEFRPRSNAQISLDTAFVDLCPGDSSRQDFRHGHELAIFGVPIVSE